MKQSEGLCQPAAENAEGRKRPLVWFMAQGYAIRGGNEAHILHYATELRNHGFDTKAVVPNVLPKHEHLFMRLLHERGIPLESVGDSVAARTLIAFCVLVLPWTLRQALKRRKFSFNDFRNFLSHRMTAHALRKKIAAEAPDIIHIFGRLADNLWSVIPPERTVFHHATEGRVDKSWEASEIENFRRFAESAARNFAPGSGVAGNVRRGFGIHRPIDTIFTMCQDERGDQGSKSLKTVQGPESLNDFQRLSTTFNESFPRFGILCRFTDEKGISYILEALKQYREKHGDVDFTLRRQDSPWLATGRNSNGGYGGFRSDTPRLRAWSFTFAGQGELEGMIRGFIESNRLSNVRLARVSTASEILKDIDVFVHPSVTDAMPMAIVEALMCWCPCISTRVGGIPDLVRDGIEGFLIEPKRSDQILEQMERFAAMPEEEFAGFRKRARARYEERCTPSKVGAIVASHYRDIIGNR